MSLFFYCLLFFAFSPFLCDCHLLNVPIYFLHESLGLDLSQLLSGNWSLVVPHVWNFSPLARLQATPLFKAKFL